MEGFDNLLHAIRACDACSLLQDNNSKNIPFVEIVPKPYAKAMFIGRDPNPNSVEKVGLIDKRSSFNRGVLKVINGISEDKIYITNILKCHWRVSSSSSNPYIKTGNRKASIPVEKSRTCILKWLTREIELVKPKVIVTFGEEAYQHLKGFIVNPNLETIPKLSATTDKSRLDAEIWQFHNGPIELKIGDNSVIYFAIRHPGNFGLRKDDIRRQINDANILKINRVISEL